jgi:hypothetical protein
LTVLKTDGPSEAKISRIDPAFGAVIGAATGWKMAAGAAPLVTASFWMSALSADVMQRYSVLACMSS